MNLSDFIEFFGNSESAFARGAHPESLVRRRCASSSAPVSTLSRKRLRPQAGCPARWRASGTGAAKRPARAKRANAGKCGARPTSPTCSSIRHGASRRMELKLDISMNNICSVPMIAVAAQTRWRGRSGSSRLFRLSISLSVYHFLILHGGISVWCVISFWFYRHLSFWAARLAAAEAAVLGMDSGFRRNDGAATSPEGCRRGAS